jgi:arginyl-tRNA--protein-N-Asp/Glu arginylyltransferase
MGLGIASRPRRVARTPPPKHADLAMRTRIVRPERLEIDQLDAYLADGWYRIGQSMMWCRLIVFEGELRSAVWTRTRLDGWTLRKGQRKLLRRLGRQYRVKVSRRKLSDAHEALYERYLTVARGERPATLREVAYGDAQHDLFDTREISLWEGDRLAAFSWFDLGRSAVQSVIGVYDPTDSRESLGYATMLLEAVWARRRGYAFHYSGYVLPGEPAMDYKLRIGGIEYLDLEGAWRPWGDLEAEDTPSELLRGALGSVKSLLDVHEVPSGLRLYDMCDAPALNHELRGFLSDPLFLEVHRGTPADTALLVTWSPMSGPYRLLRCRRTPGYVRLGADASSPVREVELLVPVSRVAASPSAESIAAEVRRRVG